MKKSIKKYKINKMQLLRLSVLVLLISYVLFCILKLILK